MAKIDVSCLCGHFANFHDEHSGRCNVIRLGIKNEKVWKPTAMCYCQRLKVAHICFKTAFLDTAANP